MHQIQQEAELILLLAKINQNYLHVFIYLQKVKLVMMNFIYFKIVDPVYY